MPKEVLAEAMRSLEGADLGVLEGLNSSFVYPNDRATVVAKDFFVRLV